MSRKIHNSTPNLVIRKKIEQLKEKTVHETDETILIRYNIEINILEEILKEGEK